VEALLAGESLDTSRLSYDFDSHHVALVAVGPDARSVVEERARATSRPHMVLNARGVIWSWIAKREAFEPAEVEALADRTAADLRLAVGEPGQDVAGWRLTHNQARAALAVALRGGEAVVRYADVALLTAVVRDEVLATSLRRLYLEPLDNHRGGGDELRRTLRAYFAAGRNVSLAGESIGVTRQAVARRLRAVEEKIGRSIGSCGTDLELALRLDALESAATPLSVP
jgi:DNA-binding PucR family transcriptional regulator